MPSSTRLRERRSRSHSSGPNNHMASVHVDASYTGNGNVDCRFQLDPFQRSAPNGPNHLPQSSMISLLMNIVHDHCRYWKHVLRAEEVVKGDHPSLTPWLDLESDKCMFHDHQLDRWEHEHLRACHWYIEMPVDRTPQHEERNRQSVEPSFRNVQVMPLRSSAATQVGAKRPRGKGKSTTPKAQASRKDASGRASKRGPPPVAAESHKRSRVQDDHTAQNEPEEEALSISQNKSSKDISKSSIGLGASDRGLRSSLVCHDIGGREPKELVLNVSVSALLENSDISQKMSRFLTKV
jgi:hypothetical protein